MRASLRLEMNILYLNRDFFYYRDFAGLEINEIFSDEILSKNKVLLANEFRSTLFINNGELFSVKELPLISQISPVRDIQVLDYNNDNNMDILLFGNLSNVSNYFGSFDSSYGILLSGNGNATFNYINQLKSGLKIRGDVNKVLPLDKNKSKFVLGKNDDKLSIISLEDEN